MAMFELLREPPFRTFLVANAAERLAVSAFTVLLGFQVYDLTKDPLSIAWLGLVQAVPGVTLVLYGGHFADRHDRRRIAYVAAALLAAIAAAAAAASAAIHGTTIYLLLLLAFLAAVVRSFEDPALSGLEAQVVPAGQVIPGMTLLATSSRFADVVGPAIGGLVFAATGPVWTYAAIAGLFAVTSGLLFGRLPSAQVVHEGLSDERSALRRIGEGVTYVARDQVLFGSMMLDLFAVFFGGVSALLPLFATEILGVGAAGLGLLRSAEAAGSLAAALTAGRFLPQNRAGVTLLAVVAGFGVSIIVFGLSRSLPLSFAALFVAGFCDGVSVLIRRAIIRLSSPESMRGRISAVRSVFIGSSNELGAVESGLAAKFLGPTAAVWTGGLVTLAIVAGAAILAPRLRELDLLRLSQTGPRPAGKPSPAKATG